MRLAIYLGVTWIIFATIGFGFGKWAFGSPEVDRFAEKGVPIYGYAVEKYPDKHATIRYSYEVGEKQYDGVGNSGYGNPGFDEIQIGQKVVVFYDPEAPEQSMMGYPQSYNQINRYGTIFSAIFFPIFPMVIVCLVYFFTKRMLK